VNPFFRSTIDIFSNKDAIPSQQTDRYEFNKTVRFAIIDFNGLASQKILLKMLNSKSL
jgi:hypothetical protein